MGYMHEFMDAELDESPTATSAGTVVTYWGPGTTPTEGHELWTLDAIARALAAIKGYRFAGAYDPGDRHAGHLYFVPRDTLVSSDANRLPINGEADLFGGVVRHAFVATKTITHPLIGSQALAPQGWSQRFPERVAQDVLRGYSAFNIADARRAAVRLLDAGPVRLKLASSSGGTGQQTASDAAELDAALSELDADGMVRHGLVVEEDLSDVTTYSVGQVRIDKLSVSY